MAVNDSLSAEQWYRYRFCVEHGHYPFLAKADKCDKFFVGLQWDEQDIQPLKATRRPALTVNKIISTLSTIMGEQIYNRNEVTFRPAKGGDPAVADALTKVWMQIAQNNQLPWVRSDLFADGIIRSRGFVDARLEFGDSMQGEVKITQLNSKNVVIDPDAEEYDPDMWNDVFTTKWMSPQDIAILYNEDDAKYLGERDASAFPYGYDSIERVRDRFAGNQLTNSYYGHKDTTNVRRNVRIIERQYRKLDTQKHFVDIVTGDMRPIPDSWQRDKIAHVLERAGGQISVTKKKIKRIRWTVTADNAVLHDEWSPFKHFTVVPYFPHFRYGQTVGLVENLLGPQELLNKTLSQELHVINTSANSGWKVKAGNLVNMSVEELEAMGASTGLVLEVQDIGQIDKILPNQVPTGLDRVSYKAEEHMKTISGVSDSMQGFDREDVAAKAIGYKKQSGQTNIAKVMDNLERTDYLLARNVLDMVQGFYTEERVINIVGTDVMAEHQQVTVNQPDPVTGEIINDLTLGEYSIVITSQPFRATMEDSQFEQARALKELGVPIPDKVLIENSRLQNRTEIIKLMEGDKESPEAQAQAQLQMRAQEAEVANIEADAMKKQAEAQKTAAEAQGGDGAELAKMQKELEMEERRLEMELAAKREELEMKREEHQMVLAQKQTEHQQNLAMKQQEGEARMEQQRQDSIMKRAQMARSQSQQPAKENLQ